MMIICNAQATVTRSSAPGETGHGPTTILKLTVIKK